MRRHKWIWKAVIGGVTLLGVAAAGAGAAERVVLTGDAVQELPKRVSMVVVGPDDRVWLSLKAARGKEQEISEEEVAREFKEKLPQITGLTPVLFEAGGRVWFVTEAEAGGQTILGYDGKTFISKKLKLEESIRGVAREAEGDYTRVWNRAVGDHAFFAGERGVYCFDGKAWSYQAMGKRDEAYVSMMMPTSDGKGLMVMQHGERETPTRVWRWRDEKWTSATLPAKVLKDRHPYVLWGDENVLAVEWAWGPSGWSAAREISLAPPKGTVADVVKRMGSEVFAEREKASADLKAMGVLVLPEVEAVIRDSKDSEVVSRLTAVKESLTGDQPTVVGKWSMEKVTFCVTSPDGKTFIGGRGLTEVGARGKRMEAGMVVREWSGKMTLVADKKCLEGWVMEDPDAEEAAPFFVGDYVWLFQPGSDGKVCRRMDVVHWTVETNLPAGVSGWFYGMMRDGTVIAGDEPRGVDGPQSIKVYRAVGKRKE